MDQKRGTTPGDNAALDLDAKAILDVLSDGISIQDTELRVIYQNAAHKALVGEHAGEYCYAAYQKLDAPCEGCHLVESFHDGKVHRRETSARASGVKQVEIISTPLFDSEGQVVAGIEAVRDISERKLAEERLMQHRFAMEAGMDGMAILDSEGNYLYLNQAHVELYGYNSPAELVGKSWKTLYHDDERERFETSIMPAFMRNGNWRGEAVGKRRDGSRYPQELSLAALPDGGIVCVVRDISERKRNEQAILDMNRGLERRAHELALANQELESYSYSLSHDIRGYLSRISLSVQLLEEEYAPSMDQTAVRLLHTVQEATEGMDGLIQAMLELFRASRGELVLRQVDLSDLAHDVASLLKEGEPSRCCEIVIQPGLSAEGDLAMLRVLLENLIGNAWKYTSRTERGRIEFGSTSAGGRQAFFVRDNGAGFRMQDVNRLFKPFQRLHSGQEFPGTGIGLATVLRIVQRHHGEVWAEGEPDQGATFYFTVG